MQSHQLRSPPFEDDAVHRVMNSDGVGVYAFDRHGKILHINAAGADIVGWSVAELIGRPAHELLHRSPGVRPVSAPERCWLLQLADAGRCDHKNNDVFWHRGGHPIPIWWTMTSFEPIAATGQSTADMVGVVMFGTVGETVGFATESPVEYRRRDHNVSASPELAEADAIEPPLVTRLTVLARLAELLDELDVISGLDQVAQIVADLLADGCVIDRLDRFGGVNRVSLAVTGLAATEATRELHPLPPLTGDSSGPLARVLRGEVERELIVLGEAVDRRPCPNALDEAQAQMFDQIGARKAVVLPLSADGRVLGAMTWLRRDPRTEFSAADLQLAHEFARRIGRWMRNQRLRMLQQHAALTLQRSLLTPLPQPDDLDIAARYQPAAEGVEVGGDWYDALTLEDGRTVITIGDVSGHDIAAAAVMAQLRSMLRFSVLRHPGAPAQVLSNVDDAMPALGIERLSSAVTGTISMGESGQHRFRWSNAGHLPPLLILGSGKVELLDRPADLLLGVGLGVERHTHTRVLPLGSTLVLYTDGLVERRSSTLESGLEQLTIVAGPLAELPVEALCDQLLAAMTEGDELNDDIALVAVRPVWTGPRFAPELEWLTRRR